MATTNLAQNPALAVYGPHVVVELPALPGGVTVDAAVDAKSCGCGDPACYFCVALDEAVWEAVWRDELEDWREKHDPTYWEYGL
jgi:hypothetical protein